MTLTPEQLSAYLDMLREKGISQFECEEFSVSFLPQAMEQDLEDTPVRAEPKNAWGDRRLWNGHEPPKFPGKG